MLFHCTVMETLKIATITNATTHPRVWTHGYRGAQHLPDNNFLLATVSVVCSVGRSPCQFCTEQFSFPGCCCAKFRYVEEGKLVEGHLSRLACWNFNVKKSCGVNANYHENTWMRICNVIFQCQRCLLSMQIGTNFVFFFFFLSRIVIVVT